MTMGLSSPSQNIIGDSKQGYLICYPKELQQGDCPKPRKTADRSALTSSGFGSHLWLAVDPCVGLQSVRSSEGGMQQMT